MAARPCPCRYPIPFTPTKQSPFLPLVHNTTRDSVGERKMLQSLLTSQIVHSRGNPLWLPCRGGLPSPGCLLYTNLAHRSVHSRGNPLWLPCPGGCPAAAGCPVAAGCPAPGAKGYSSCVRERPTQVETTNLRIVQDLFVRPLQPPPPALQNYSIVGETQPCARVLLDQHDCAATALHHLDCIYHLLECPGIQPHRRLIQQDQTRVQHQAARKFD